MIEHAENLDKSLVLDEIFKRDGKRVIDKFDGEVNEYGISHIVDWGKDSEGNDIKVAVMARLKLKTCKVSGKHLSRVKKFMDLYECTHGVIYTVEENIPSAVYKIAAQLGIELVDGEDLRSITKRIDQRK